MRRKERETVEITIKIELGMFQKIGEALFKLLKQRGIEIDVKTAVEVASALINQMKKKEGEGD